MTMLQSRSKLRQNHQKSQKKVTETPAKVTAAHSAGPETDQEASKDVENSGESKQKSDESHVAPPTKIPTKMDATEAVSLQTDGALQNKPEKTEQVSPKAPEIAPTNEVRSATKPDSTTQKPEEDSKSEKKSTEKTPTKRKND